MTNSTSSTFYINMVGLHDIKIKGSISFWKIKTASPINLINQKKAKPSQALQKEIRDGLSRVLEAPGRLQGNLEHMHVCLFKKAKLTFA